MITLTPGDKAQQEEERDPSPISGPQPDSIWSLFCNALISFLGLDGDMNTCPKSMSFAS